MPYHDEQEAAREITNRKIPNRLLAQARDDSLNKTPDGKDCRTMTDDFGVCMLTPKQEIFCENIAKGMNQTDAYRNAFNLDTAKPESAYTMASRLLRNVKVRLRIDELRDGIVKELNYTAKESFDNLTRIQEMALQSKRLNEALKAEELKGRLCGLYVERKDISGSLDTSPFEVKIVK